MNGKAHAIKDAIVLKRLHDPQFYDKWDWYNLSWNPNIIWDIIQKNPDKPWDWWGISRNPNITWEIVKHNPNKPWDWLGLSKNPNFLCSHDALSDGLFQDHMVSKIQIMRCAKKDYKESLPK